MRGPRLSLPALVGFPLPHVEALSCQKNNFSAYAPPRLMPLPYLLPIGGVYCRLYGNDCLLGDNMSEQEKAIKIYQEILSGQSLRFRIIFL
jgi:hypothetical protein